MEQLRRELNGFGDRLREVEEMKGAVRRNEEDIQKIFTNLDKIPDTNKAIMKDVNSINQKLLNKVIYTMVTAFVLMAVKEFVTK